MEHYSKMRNHGVVNDRGYTISGTHLGNETPAAGFVYIFGIYEQNTMSDFLEKPNN